ncbi:hypothetical protein ABZ752_15305 [Streptomyces roseifaciens]
MQAAPRQVIEFRPCLHYGSIELVLVAFSQQPEDDGVVSLQGPALHLSCNDASNYPLLRVEYLTASPDVVPTGDWDYQRTLNGMEISHPPINMLSPTGPVEAELDVPKGFYSLRVLRGLNPAYEEPSDEPDEFIDDDYEEDADPGEPQEHWLIQIWPQSVAPTA